MPLKKFFVFPGSILTLFFSPLTLAHETGFFHQHGEELVALSILAIVLIAGSILLKSIRSDR